MIICFLFYYCAEMQDHDLIDKPIVNATIMTVVSSASKEI